MMFASYPFASVPFAASLSDAAILPDVPDLIADQESDRAYLFHATPFDPVGAAEVDVYASIGLKHPIVDSVAWPAILKTAVDSQVELFGEDESAQGRTSFGNLELLTGDGAHDDLTGYHWDGRDVEVLLGAEGFTIDEYETILKGTAEDITYDQRRVGIVFRGKEELLDKEIQENTYAGSGGLEGDETLQGNEKPLVYGDVTNITPVLVDADNLVYQFHDGPAQSVQNAFDGGLALDSLLDVGDITVATVPAGYYKTQLSGGYIKLGAPPAKLLTMDVRGDASGNGYVRNAADIIKRIVIDKADLTADDLNLPSFFAAKLDSSRSSSGIYVSRGTVANVITELMFSIGGAWTFNRLGELTVAVFRKRLSSGTIDENDIVKGTLKRVRTQAPSWWRRIGFKKAWTVFTEDQFVGAASSFRRQLLTAEYRHASNSDSGIKTDHLGARTVVKDTLLASPDDASTEVLRQQALFGSAFDRVDVTTRRQQFRYQVGQTITVPMPVTGTLQDMIILGVRENTSLRQTTFRLWGSRQTVEGAITDPGTGAAITDPVGGAIITDPGL